jgi:hypothetical protein
VLAKGLGSILRTGGKKQLKIIANNIDLTSPSAHRHPNKLQLFLGVFIFTYLNNRSILTFPDFQLLAAYLRK